MTDSLRPISSYDMPTDKQYEELNELGKEFLEERNVKKRLKLKKNNKNKTKDL